MEGTATPSPRACVGRYAEAVAPLHVPGQQSTRIAVLVAPSEVESPDWLTQVIVAEQATHATDCGGGVGIAGVELDQGIAGNGRTVDLQTDTERRSQRRRGMDLTVRYAPANVARELVSHQLQLGAGSDSDASA